MALDKNYPEGKTYKSRGNYPIGFCGDRKDCRERKCDKCVRINGKYTGFEAK